MNRSQPSAHRLHEKDFQEINNELLCELRAEPRRLEDLNNHGRWKKRGLINGAGEGQTMLILRDH